VRAVVGPGATLAAALESLVGSRIGAVAVVDDGGALLGTLDLDTIMAAVETMRAGGRETTPADRTPSRDEVAAP
jgi:CBS domain-containing protein